MEGVAVEHWEEEREEEAEPPPSRVGVAFPLAERVPTTPLAVTVPHTVGAQLRDTVKEGDLV